MKILQCLRYATFASLYSTREQNIVNGQDFSSYMCLVA
jgi:hypothetical protein